VWANSAPCGACEYCRLGREALCDDLLFWNGAYAEYSLLPARLVERNLLSLPEGVPFERAALVEPLACAVRGVADSRIEAGQDVVVIGAGPLGLMLLQLATRRGARVTTVGRRRGPLEAARLLGAVDVVSAEDGDVVEQLLARSPGGRGYPVVIEAVGRVETSQAALASVRKGGLVNLFGGCAAGTELVLDLQHFHYQELRLVATFHHTPAAIREAFDLIVSGGLPVDGYVTGVVDLAGLPARLVEIAAGQRQLKTAVRPQTSVLA
jgi:L-iditol 2-dehydrogenase